MFHIKNLFLVYLIVPFISSCILSLFQEGNILSYFYGYLYFFINKIFSVAFKFLFLDVSLSLSLLTFCLFILFLTHY